MIDIYTDGSITVNPGGQGGWAFVLLVHGVPLASGAGSEPATTNNRMEVRAILESIRTAHALFPGSQVSIVTDSRYAINCCRGAWRRQVNLDLFEEFDQLATHTPVLFQWVKGHSGDEWNEHVDRLARQAAFGPAPLDAAPAGTLP